MKTNKLGFEIETCSRCHGGGKYSYCRMYGDRCFKCAGSGAVYTKRGAAARNFFEKLCTKKASEITIGEHIRVTNITHGGRLFEHSAKVFPGQSRALVFS